CELPAGRFCNFLSADRGRGRKTLQNFAHPRLVAGENLGVTSCRLPAPAGSAAFAGIGQKGFRKNLPDRAAARGKIFAEPARPAAGPHTSFPWSEADLKNLVLPLHLEKLRDVLCDRPLAPAGHDPPADPAEKARRHTKRLPQQPINKAQKPSLHHRFTLVRGRDLPATESRLAYTSPVAPVSPATLPLLHGLLSLRGRV